MPDSPKIISQVAKLESRMESVEENIGVRLDAAEENVSVKVDNLRDDIHEIKLGQEEMWRELRKFQATTVQLLHQAENERGNIRNDVKSVKETCDIRHVTQEKYKKAKLAILLTILPPVGAAIWDQVKKMAGLA